MENLCKNIFHDDIIITSRIIGDKIMNEFNNIIDFFEIVPKDFTYEELMAEDLNIQAILLAKQANSWKFICYPNFYQCLDQIISRSPLDHKELCQLICINFYFVYAEFDVPNLNEFKNEVIQENTKKEVLDFVKFLDYESIIAVEQYKDNIKETNEIILFMLSVLSDNKLRRKAVPYFHEYLDQSWIKKGDMLDLVYFLNDLPEEQSDLLECLRLTFAFFLYWLCKRYDYALTVLYLLSSKCEYLLSDEKSNAAEENDD